MKSEKGQPVFIDDVDVLLTEKIVDHTVENADKNTDGVGFYDTVRRKAPPRPRKEGFLKMSKTKWIVLCVIGVLLIAGLVACFLVRPGMCCKK